MVKSIKKRKVSIRYICWLVASLILFTMFFLIMVFQYRIFDKFVTTEVKSLKGSSADRYVITFMVDGEEYISYLNNPTRTPKRFDLKEGDKIQYLKENPSVVYHDRPKSLIILSITDSVILLTLVGATIYEIKRGL